MGRVFTVWTAFASIPALLQDRARGGVKVNWRCRSRDHEHPIKAQGGEEMHDADGMDGTVSRQ